MANYREQRDKKEHPSYGFVTVSRATGNFDNLFQSSIGGNTGMVLTIKRAAVHDDGLGCDHVQPGAQLIEVRLSPLQWAEMISSISLGGGTPCTLHWLNGDLIPEPPKEEALAFRNAKDFKTELDDLATFSKDAGRRVKDILAKGGKMKAADREALGVIFQKLTGTITDSGPFLVKQTEQALNRMVEEAKAAITSHASTLQVEPGAVTVPALDQGTDWEIVTEQPVIPDLGPREKDLKDVEDYTAAEVAESINFHLHRIERDEKRRRREGQATEIAKRTDEGAMDDLYHPDVPHLWCSGSWLSDSAKQPIHVGYVSYQRGSALTLEAAVIYLKALRRGFRGRHHHGARPSSSRAEASGKS